MQLSLSRALKQVRVRVRVKVRVRAILTIRANPHPNPHPKQREWRSAFRLALGWLINHFFFVALMLARMRALTSCSRYVGLTIFFLLLIFVFFRI